MRDAVDATDFFGEDRSNAGPQTYDRFNRYLLDADGKGPRPYTRATTLAKTLEDDYHLSEWKARCAARGVALRDDLVARAKATPVDDKRVWKEILAEAEVVNGGGVKRNMGSAFHEFHERVPKMSGAEFAAQSPLIKATYAKYRAALEQCGIVEILTEVTLVNTKIGSAGKADGIARLRDGRYVIIDRKSGRITEYPHSACQQLAIYANSDVMITYDENGAPVRHELPPLDKHTAIVIDVTIGDENTASVAVYEIDIWSGWAAALLACDVRRWRNRRDLVKPFHPDAPARSAAEQPSSAANFHGQAVVGVIAAMDDRTVTIQQADGATTSYTIPAVTSPSEDQARALVDAVRTEVAAIANSPAPAAAGVPMVPAHVPDPVEVAHGPTANAPAATGHSDSEAFTNAQNTGDPYVQGPPRPAGGTRQVFSSLLQRNVTVDANGDPVPHKFVVVQGQMTCGECLLPAGDPASKHIVDRPAAPVDDENPDVAALLGRFKTKAQLQTAAKSVDPAMPLNRTRANLAKDMVSNPGWPTARATLLPPDPNDRVQQASDEAAAAYPVPSDAVMGSQLDVPESFSPVVSNAPGPVPPDPQPKYGERATDSGMSVGFDEAAAQQPVPAPADASVQDGYDGPPPWAVPAPAAVAEKTPEELMLDRIAAATTTGPGSELAAVWQHAKDNGITWTPRLHQAAEIRHKDLAANAVATKGA
jgi:hypothetical protein